MAVENPTLEQLRMIRTWALQNLKKNEFEGKGIVQISYRTYLSPKNTDKKALVVIPGKGEAALKYSELVYDLKDTNTDIYILDHRGQGESDRLTDDRHKEYVEHFSDYVSDLKKFMDHVVKPNNYKKIWAVAHSMGGAVLGGYLLKYPNEFSAVVLSAPMFQINTDPYPEGVALVLAKSFVLVGRGRDYAPGQGPEEGPKNQTVLNNPYSLSEVRYQSKHEFYQEFPELQVAGVANRWVLESLVFTNKLQKMAHLFQVPTFLFQAGSDKVVRPKGQNKICLSSKEFCKLEIIPEAEHELLMERDSIRNVVINKLIQLIEQ